MLFYKACSNRAPSLGPCSVTNACLNTDTQTCETNICCPSRLLKYPRGYSKIKFHFFSECSGGATSPGLCAAGNSCAAFPTAPDCVQGICCPGSVGGANKIS